MGHGLVSFDVFRLQPLFCKLMHYDRMKLLPSLKSFCFCRDLFIGWFFYQQGYSKSYGWVIMCEIFGVGRPWQLTNNWLDFQGYLQTSHVWENSI